MAIHFDRLDNPVANIHAPFGLVAGIHRKGFYRNYGKRVLDIAFVLLVSPMLLILVGILALFIARDGNSPFYWSRRVGRNGATFRMLKLRTMVPNADILLEIHLARNSVARKEWITSQKLKRDPRITRFGRLLRKTSLDELPQFWNVLRGEMSLFGPRPMLPSQRALYPGLAYYNLRPGISGPWQVADRNECEFARRAEFDKDYDDNLSLGGDLKLLAQTIRVVLGGTGY